MRVLVVEKPDITGNSITRTLLTALPDVEVVTCSTLKEAIDQLHRCDFAIFDLAVPDCRLDDILNAIHVKMSLPRAVCTGNVTPEAAHECGKRGVGYIPKTTDPDAYMAMLYHTLGMFEYRQAKNRRIDAVLALLGEKDE